MHIIQVKYMAIIITHNVCVAYALEMENKFFSLLEQICRKKKLRSV